MSQAEVDAELARSILACPESAELAVDGHPTVGCDDDLGLRDEDGAPSWCSAAVVTTSAECRWRRSAPPHSSSTVGVLLRRELHAGIC